MEINLQESLMHFECKIYMGNRSRGASLTDVAFVSQNRIVAAHRCAAKLYYIQINDDGGYTLLDELILTIHNKPHPTEMMDVVGSTIYMTSFTEYMSIVDIRENRFVLRSSTRMNYVGTPYHGIEVFRNFVYVTPSNKATGDDRIIIWNIEKNKIESRIELPNIGKSVRIKDITHVSEDRIVLLGAYKCEERDMMAAGYTSNGFIGLYTNDFVELDRVEFEGVHFDSVTSKDGTFFGTGADMEGGYIYVGTIDGNSLSPIVKHPAQDFPHGIAVYHDKLAYTSYSTSSLYITDIATYM
jgi:hypothetical protein